MLNPCQTQLPSIWYNRKEANALSGCSSANRYPTKAASWDTHMVQVIPNEVANTYKIRGDWDVGVQRAIANKVAMLQIPPKMKMACLPVYFNNGPQSSEPNAEEAPNAAIMKPMLSIPRAQVM